MGNLPVAPSTFYENSELDAWVRRYITDFIEQMPPLALATKWWAPYAYMFPNAPLKMTIVMPVSYPRMTKHTGQLNIQRPDKLLPQYDRDDEKELVFGANIQKLWGGDLEGFAIAPQLTAAAVDKDADITFGELLNNGMNTLDWTGRRFFVLNTADVALRKPHNPGITGTDAALYYTNLRENFPLTPENLTQLLQDLHERKGYDLEPITNENREVELWVPPAMLELANNLIKRQQILFENGTGGTNVVLGRLPVKLIPNLRADMWGVVMKPQGMQELPFLFAMGDNPNANTEFSGFPSWQREQGVSHDPHRRPVIIDTNDPRFKMNGTLAYGVIQNQTAKLFNGQCLNFATTGLAGVVV